MLQSRSSSRTRAKNLSNSPSPSSRLGCLFPPFGRDSVTPALGCNLHFRPVELGSLDPHAMQNNRELTCDRNLGLAEPVALGEPFAWAGLGQPRMARARSYRSCRSFSVTDKPMQRKRSRACLAPNLGFIRMATGVRLGNRARTAWR